MAPVLAVVLVVEYVGLRAAVPTRADRRPAAGPRPTCNRVPVFPLVVVGLMLVGFAAVSPFGGQPWWVSAAAAVVLAVWGYRHGLLGVRDLVRSAHPGFAIWVLALGVVVAGLAVGFLGEAVGDLLPDSLSLGGIVLIAVIATVLANLVTNLSATLLLVPAGRAARDDRRAGRAARAQHRQRADLDRLAGQPAVAPHPHAGTTRRPAARRSTGSRWP